MKKRQTSHRKIPNNLCRCSTFKGVGENSIPVAWARHTDILLKRTVWKGEDRLSQRGNRTHTVQPGAQG